MRTETARRVARVDRAARVLFALALAPTAGGLCAFGGECAPSDIVRGAALCTAAGAALAVGGRCAPRVAWAALAAAVAVGAPVLLPVACALVARASAALARRAAKSETSA